MRPVPGPLGSVAADRVRDRAVLHDPPVDEHMLRPSDGPLLGESGNEAVQAQAAELAVDRRQVLAIAIHLIQPI